MKSDKKHGRSETLLQAAALRPTRPRVIIADWLFEKPRHVTADEIYIAMKKAKANISLATIYNTLNLFVGAGLLKQICLDATEVIFDSNLKPHHYLYDEETEELKDIPPLKIGLPNLPKGKKLSEIDVIVRIKRA